MARHIATLEEAVRDFLAWIEETEKDEYMDTGVVLDYANLFRRCLPTNTGFTYQCVHQQHGECFLPQTCTCPCHGSKEA